MQVNTRRTRIVCTLGPSSDSQEQLQALLDRGMDVARLNLSHGSHEHHREVVSRLRQLSPDTPVLLDLQGPKIRVGRMRDGVQSVRAGEQVRFTAENVEGDATRIPIDYPALADDVLEGNTLLLDDGLLEFRVEAVDGGDVLARVVVGGPLKSRKGVNLPDVRTSLSALSEKDLQDLAFAADVGVEFIAMSFVRSATDVQDLLQRTRELGSSAAIIAKIEKPEALQDIDAIIAVADGIMIARGDLGIEMASEQLPLIQKDLIERCRRASKPVITATQMLESMISNPRPTRAESSDVANAVLDGSDALMLSGETAAGQYPIEAVATMDRICRSVEGNTAKVYHNLGFLTPVREEKKVIEALSYSCVSMARDTRARAIATITHSGKTAQRIAKYRPDVPIIAFTESQEVLRQLQLVWGVTAIKLEELFDTDRSLRLMEDFLKSEGIVKAGDRVVMATGIPVAKRGRTNMVTIASIAD